MFGRTKSIPLAIDIGSNSIKILQVKEDTTDVPKIEKIAVAKTPYGCIRDGFIQEPKQVVEVLKKVLQVNQIREKKCITAISGQQVIARLVKLPPMTEQEVKQAIYYQAERYIPFPVEQVILDIIYLGEIVEADTRKVAVLLVAAQKDAINVIVQVFADAGLQLLSIDVEPFVSLRAAVEFFLNYDEQAFNEGTVLVLDVGASACNISVVSRGILRFSRIIPIAGNNLTKSIAAILNTSYDEAEQAKKLEGCAFIDEEVSKELSTVVTRQICNIMSPILSSLLNEIQRSLVYYESRFRRATIDKLLLAGGSSKLRNLSKYFANELGLEVTVTNPLLNFNHDETKIRSDYLHEVAPLFNVACGLSLSALPEERLNRLTKSITIDNNFEFGSSRQTATVVGPAFAERR